MGLITSTNYCVNIFVYLKGLCIYRPPALASAPSPNLYLPALGPSLYLTALAPNLYLQALAPNLCLQVLASNFYLPVLVSPDPGLAYINFVPPICLTVL